MSEKLELRNFVGGEHADTADGRRMDLVDPTTGEVFALRAGLRRRGRRPRLRAPPPSAFETWRDTTPVRAAAGAAAARRRWSRSTPTSWCALESRNTGKPLGLTASEEIPPMVDQIRFFAGAARTLEGKAAAEYMAGPHLLGPARADRRRRPGDAVELPDDDGGLEDRPGARGRQHRRAQAERHHPGDHAAAGRAGRRGPAARRAQRRLRRPGHRPGAGRAPRPRSWWRSPGRCGPGMRGRRAPRARDVKRVHLELGGKAPVVVFDDADLEAAAEAIAVAGYFNAGQDCTAATRVLAAPRHPRRLRGRAHRAGPQHHHDVRQRRRATRTPSCRR